MKRLCAFLFALLLTHSDYSRDLQRCYVVVIYTDGRTYEEYIPSPYIHRVFDDYLKYDYLQSLFICKESFYVSSTDSH